MCAQQDSDSLKFCSLDQGVKRGPSDRNLQTKLTGRRTRQRPHHSWTLARKTAARDWTKVYMGDKTRGQWERRST